MKNILLITENMVVVVAELEAAAVLVVVVVVVVVVAVVEDTANPLQAWTDPWSSRRLRLPEFLDIKLYT
jgi:hypothetical protein